ncbi:MAG: hypothetical protein HY976_00885 [Candidatus Kerfeldbacteria bacterium]|nr:hypothetical protein [Candidatus Kerfeldbacteria bacterium]
MKKTIVSIASLGILVLPFAASAATPFTVENFGGQVGLGTADLKGTIVNIISWVLGIVSLVAVVMIIIGGLQWMTSGGNEEKVEKAKKTISSAVVGIVIVILAWAIVIFTAGTTRNVTG